MRDARPKSREECGARRDRALARRRAREPVAIDTPAVVDASWRLAGAIALASLTFIVWNVGTRSPVSLLLDIRRAARDARAFFLGLIAFAVGTIFMIASLVLVLPAIGLDADVWPTLVLMFVVALAIELLIGPAVRGLSRESRATFK